MDKNQVAIPDRRAKCSSCGSIKVSTPTSRYFMARPDKDFDSDWCGCTEGSGT